MVRHKAMSIALSMMSSHNVKEIMLFLKKWLQKTQEAHYSKVCDALFGVNPSYKMQLITVVYLGSRILAASDSVHSRYCHQLLRSRSKCHTCFVGVPWRL